MKKRIFAAMLCVVLALCIILSSGCALGPHVELKTVRSANARFKHDKTDFSGMLKTEDAEAIRAMFNGKRLHKDMPSCGFTENVSVRFNGEQTFCIANDMCGIIYLKEADKYFNLSKDERTRLNDILSAYGFYFPCL